LITTHVGNRFESWATLYRRARHQGGARVRVGGEAERRHFDGPSRFPQRRRRTTQSSPHLTRRRRSGPRAPPSQGAQPAGRSFVRVCGAKVLRDSDGTEGCRGPVVKASGWPSFDLQFEPYPRAIGGALAVRPGCRSKL
jgi:hypothetical protein